MAISKQSQSKYGNGQERDEPTTRIAG